MKFQTLQDWLSWQESLNPKEIDLGLDRVSLVLDNLNISADFFCPVITVAGTNGKGSTVAFVESILKQSGISVGCYSSPHLFSYNERIRIDQQPVTDEVLCDAFEVIDQARGDVALTYFEFGTLASLVIFKRFNVQVSVLEVGLGGRLDAVNIINADVSIITSIDIDHVDWLGDDIEQIALEKAGVMRTNKPAIVAYMKPQTSLLSFAEQQQVPLIRLGRDYIYQGLANQKWQLKSSNGIFDDLPLPKLQGGFQLQNAAAAIMAIQSLNIISSLKSENIAKGLHQVELAGRYQLLATSPNVFVDVAHNRQSATMLAELLADSAGQGKTIAVIAMLADKPVADVITIVAPQIDHWVSAGLEVSRGLSANNLAQAVRESIAGVKLSPCKNVRQACQQAQSLASENDRIIVFGSFYTVTEASLFFKAQQHH